MFPFRAPMAGHKLARVNVTGMVENDDVAGEKHHDAFADDFQNGRLDSFHRYTGQTAGDHTRQPHLNISMFYNRSNFRTTSLKSSTLRSLCLNVKCISVSFSGETCRRLSSDTQ